MLFNSRGPLGQFIFMALRLNLAARVRPSQQRLFVCKTPLYYSICRRQETGDALPLGGTFWAIHIHGLMFEFGSEGLALPAKTVCLAACG